MSGVGQFTPVAWQVLEFELRCGNVIVESQKCRHTPNQADRPENGQ